MPACNLKEQGRKAIARVYLVIEHMSKMNVEDYLAAFLHFAYQRAKRIILMLKPKASPPPQEGESAFEPEA